MKTKYIDIRDSSKNQLQKYFRTILSFPIPVPYTLYLEKKILFFFSFQHFFLGN